MSVPSHLSRLRLVGSNCRPERLPRILLQRRWGIHGEPQAPHDGGRVMQLADGLRPTINKQERGGDGGSALVCRVFGERLRVYTPAVPGALPRGAEGAAEGAGERAETRRRPRRRRRGGAARHGGQRPHHQAGLVDRSAAAVRAVRDIAVRVGDYCFHSQKLLDGKVLTATFSCVGFCIGATASAVKGVCIFCLTPRFFLQNLLVELAFPFKY